MEAVVRSLANTRSGFSKNRLENLENSLRKHVDRGMLPGLVAAVNHRGRECVQEIGCHDFEGGKPMERDTLFRLASMTKPITAVAAMILIEECKLRLDDPVEEWLPELSNRRVLRSLDGPLEDTVPSRRSITVRDLLTFRAGFGEVEFISRKSPLVGAMVQAQLPLFAWPVSMTTDEFMKKLGALPLAHHPGDRWLYHMGAEALGVLIARASGVSLGRFLRERIFDPLGMKNTGFHASESALERLPPCYGRDYATGEVVTLHRAGESDAFYSKRPDFESGGGGLVSTVDDLLALGTMMLNNGAYGNERILSRPSVELMTQDQLTLEQKAASPFFENFWSHCGWGLGLGIVTSRDEISATLGRFGWDGAFGSSWWVDPKERLVGVFLTQRRPDILGTADFIRDFWTSAYQLIDD